MTNIRRIIAICSVIVFIAGYVFLAGHILEPTVMDMYNEQIVTFHALDENSLDLIAFGSSHTWLGIDTRLISDEYGINSYNYGCSWQHFDTTLLFMEDAIRTQHPKYMIVDTFMIDSVMKNDLTRAELDYTRKIPWGMCKIKYLHGCLSDWREWFNYCIPFFEYHSNWDSIDEMNFTGESTNTYDFFETHGFRPNDGSTSIELSTYSDLPQWELKDYSIDLLDSMVELCEDNNVRLILVTVPCGGSYWFSEAIYEYAAEHGIDYINFWKEADNTGISGDTDFLEKDHLNSSGAAKVAEYIVDYIENKYGKGANEYE